MVIGAIVGLLSVAWLITWRQVQQLQNRFDHRVRECRQARSMLYEYASRRRPKRRRRCYLVLRQRPPDQILMHGTPFSAN
jgi:hypothetical protein